MTLIAWWKLDGNAEDSIGGKDGTTSGAVSFIQGKINQSFSTDASTGRITTPLQDSFFKTSFSCSAWVRIKEWGLSQGVFGTRNSPNGWMLYRNTGDSNGLLRFYHHYTNTLDTETTTAHTYSGFPLNEWFHVVVIRTQGNYKTYFNGELVGDTNPSNFKHWNTNGTDFMIGAGGSSWQTSQMDIDDVRVYDHTLSKKEIKELAKAKVLHYKLNESESDNSGYSHDGSGINMVYTNNSKMGFACYDNDGSNRYVNCGNQPSVVHNQTIAMWLFPTSNAVRQNPWNKAYGGEGTITHETSGTLNYYWGTDGGNNTPYQGVNSSSALTLNQWSHITVVRDLNNGRVKWYINGVKTNDVSASYSEAAVSTADLLIGTGYTNPYNGRIDDVRLYATALSDEDIQEIYKQRGSVDNEGSLYTPLINETGHKPLIMDYTIWEDGQTGSVGDFGTYSSNNKRTLAIDPWGKETVVWEGESQEGSTNGSGIYFSTSTPIDNTKMYRFSFWEKRVTNSTATTCRYYFGLNGYGTTDGVYNRSNETLSTDPYFYNTSNIPTSAQLPEGEWVLIVGHVWPAGSGTGSDHPDSGRYTLNGKLGNISRDWVWHETSDRGRPRTLAIYTPDAGGVIHHSAYPRMDVVDGTEPSIAELLTGFDSNNIEYIRTKGGTSNVSLDVGSKLTNFGKISEVGPTNQLVGWFTFKGNKIDFLTKSEASIGTADYVMGLNGLALDIGSNEDSEGISIAPNDFGLNLNNESIAFWQKCDFPRLDSEGGGFTNWVFHWGTYYGNNSGGFGLQSGSFSRYLKGSTSSGWSNSGSIPDAHPIYDEGGWIHYVVVFDGNDRVRFYMNGHEVWTGIISDPYTGYDTNNIRFGRNMLATLENVRIYDKVLSPEEIKILYDITRPEGSKMKKTGGEVYVKRGLDEQY